MHPQGIKIKHQQGINNSSSNKCHLHYNKLFLHSKLLEYGISKCNFVIKIIQKCPKNNSISNRSVMVIFGVMWMNLIVSLNYA